MNHSTPVINVIDNNTPNSTADEADAVNHNNSTTSTNIRGISPVSGIFERNDFEKTLIIEINSKYWYTK